MVSLYLCSQELPGPCDQDHSSNSAAGGGELPSLAEEGVEEEREEEEMKIAWRYQAKPKVKVSDSAALVITLNLFLSSHLLVVDMVTLLI